MVLGGHAGLDPRRILIGLGVVVEPALAQPAGVGVAGAVGGGAVGAVDDRVAGLDLSLAVRLAACGAALAQVELAGESAAVAGVGEELCHQDFVGGHAPGALAGAGGAGIAAGQKAGAAGIADRALAEGVLEDQSVLR